MLALSLLPSTAQASGKAAPSRSDLEAVRLDPAPAPVGGTTEVDAFVVNRGPERTASPFRITLRVPSGLTILRPSLLEDCTPPGGRVITCVFPAGLDVLETATAIIPVKVGTEVPPGTRDGQIIVAGEDDTDRGNDRTPITFTIQDPDAP
ncbi:hypothetical protein ACFZAT_20445 [Streptomyces sp. NPDC008163]|uniref:hypothetical protein n=1 Tax=Streptomyces sp. NPDC008163 TaxID=3364818 RepID=UPI0036E32BA9